MFKSVGVATVGMAIVLPFWEIAITDGGVFLTGAVVGFFVAGPIGALTGATVSLMGEKSFRSANWAFRQFAVR